MGTWIIGVALFIIAGLAVRSIYRDITGGKSCGCSGCPGCDPAEDRACGE